MAANERRLQATYAAANYEGPPIVAPAREASLGGVFIETNTPLPTGTLLTIELSTSNAPSLVATLEARVFSTRIAPEGPPYGMALRFLDLPQGMLTKLQTILNHHRPPTRTRLGVGDENEALWASAGGRDGEDLPTSEVLAIAAAVAVEGRPTPNMPIPVATPPKPILPRYPTPRMVPISAPRPAHVPAPLPSPPPPPHVPVPSAAPPKPRWTIAVAISLALVVLAFTAALLAPRLHWFGSRP